MDSTVALLDLQLALESVCGQQIEEDCSDHKRKNKWEMSVIWWLTAVDLKYYFKLSDRTCGRTNKSQPGIRMAVSTKVANHAQATNGRVVIWLDKDQVLLVKTPFWSVKKKKEEKEQKRKNKEERVHRIWIHVHVHVLKRT